MAEKRTNNKNSNLFQSFIQWYKKRRERKIQKRKASNKSKVREYVEAILVAFVAAMILRILLVQAFRIPTGSMKDTLLVGDFLLVNKFIYGVRTPDHIGLSSFVQIGPCQINHIRQIDGQFGIIQQQLYPGAQPLVRVTFHNDAHFTAVLSTQKSFQSSAAQAFSSFRRHSSSHSGQALFRSASNLSMHSPHSSSMLGVSP